VAAKGGGGRAGGCVDGARWERPIIELGFRDLGEFVAGEGRVGWGRRAADGAARWQGRHRGHGR
jgi:hypothetical protein